MFGEQAIAAMLKEFKQLVKGTVPGKPVIKPIDPNSLDYEQKQQALEAVNLIKEKGDGTIKGKSCANGSNQRKYLKEDDTVAPTTCALESFITTLLIDAYEDRDMAIYDVPGVYLHTDIPKDKLLLM
eukprot:1079502-Ditylum_brightwellii.AAC.1